jgi:hypothetical protein
MFSFLPAIFSKTANFETISSLKYLNELCFIISNFNSFFLFPHLHLQVETCFDLDFDWLKKIYFIFQHLPWF